MANSSFINSFGIWTLTYLAHSTLLLGACWLLCRGLALRSPALRERLWKLAAVGGFVTSALAVSVGWGLAIGAIETASEVVRSADDQPDNQSPVVKTASSSTSASNDDELIREAEQLANLIEESTAASVSKTKSIESSNIVRQSLTDHRRMADVISNTSENSPGNAITSMPQTPVESATATHGTSAATTDRQKLSERINDLEQQARVPLMQSWWLALLRSVGWIAVLWMTLGLLRLLRSEWALARVIARGSGGSPERPLEQILCDIVARTTSRAPRLLFSSEITEPMACGYFKPTILLPTDIEVRLQTSELRALLAHEFAHLHRGDVVWLWIGRVLCSSFGFQPLNAIARRTWQAAAEVQCDDWAVAQDVPAVSLASCLAQVAEWKLDRRAASVLAASGSGSSLTLRIERLLSDRVPDVWSTRWRSRCSLIAAFCFGLLFASIAPRLDESLWARSTDPDLEEKLRIWNEIRSDLRGVQKSIEAFDNSGAEARQLKLRLDRQ